MIRNSETATLDDSCAEAMNLQLAGELTLAEQVYRSILHEQPAHAVANHCLGMLKVQLRRPEEGLPFLLTALSAQPEIPDYWLGYLEALLLAGQRDAAIEALALGRQRGLSGKAVEALATRLADTLRQPLSVGVPASRVPPLGANVPTPMAPAHGASMTAPLAREFGASVTASMAPTLGANVPARVAPPLGAIATTPREPPLSARITSPVAPRPAERQQSKRAGLRINSRLVRESNGVLGSRKARQQDQALEALIAKKRIPEAIVAARRMTKRFPEYGLGWKRLGALLWWQGRCEEAFIPMEHSVRLLPQDAEAHNNFGMALHRRDNIDAAIAYFRRALDIDPRCAAAHYHLGNISAMAQSFAEAESSLRIAAALRPDYLNAEARPLYSDLLFLFSHNSQLDAETLFAEHCGFGELIETPLRSIWPRHTNLKDPERRLRIGFLSGDFREHAVATFMEPLLVHLTQRHDLELHAYYNHRDEDWVTIRLRGYFPHWHPIATLSDSDAAKAITADGIDILIDLYGHTGFNRLAAFAHKPAPIQVSWLGYPGTTGMQAMDYYLTDRHWLPPGRFDHLFTEKLVYLPDRWTFERHADVPAVNILPALTSGHLTFGSFHRLNKINASTLQLWCELLLALPQSSLLLVGILPGAPRMKLIEGFAAHGVPLERLDFHDRCSEQLYLALHHRVDLALDTHPYAGGTTTMHSLSMGVPTLTLAGTTPAGRAGAGILGQVGLEGFTATNGADFVAKGLYWAQHLSELAEVRAGLPARMRSSPGGQPALFAAHFAGALRLMWRRWCAGLPAESFHSCALEPDT